MHFLLCMQAFDWRLGAAESVYVLPVRATAALHPPDHFCTPSLHLHPQMILLILDGQKQEPSFVRGRPSRR